jgi:hypothetical protein
MVCYDGTVRNSLGNLIIYGEGRTDGAFIESQYIETFGDKEFEPNYQVDITKPAAGFLPGAVQVGLDNSSAELQALLDEEHSQLVEDRPSKLHLHSRSRIHYLLIYTVLSRTLSRFPTLILGNQAIWSRRAICQRPC